MKEILKVDKIRKMYHSLNGENLAIDDVSFSVNDGEFISIVGPSGCGKSTLLNIIGKIDNASSGKIIMDKDTKIGYMLQEDSLFSWLNILDNCLLGLKIRGEINEENISYVKGLLKKYSLGNFMKEYPGSLSGGMRQRVG